MHKKHLVFSCLLLVGLLAGCADTPPKQASTTAAASAKPQPPGKPATRSWWRHFNDAALNRLIQQALSNNYSLQSAKARTAQAQLQQSGADWTDGQNSPNGSGDALQQCSSRLVGNYEQLVWQHLSKHVSPLLKPLYDRTAGFDAVSLALSARVAETYFTLQKSRSKSQLLDSQEADDRKLLRMADSQAGDDQAAADEVLQQQQLIDELQTQKIQAQAHQQILTHKLAMLVGQPASSFTPPPAVAPPKPMPSLTLAQIPTQWLEQRPDVRAALYHLQSADSTIASAIQAHFPNFNLISVVNTALISPARLFTDWLVDLTRRLSMPLLGSAGAQTAADLAKAARNEALANYRQSLMNAVQKAQDSLATAHSDRQLFRNLNQRLTLAQAIYHELKRRYAQGQVNFFQVYTALQNLQSLQRQHLDTAFTLTLDRIAVTRELAGRWAEPASTKASLVQNQPQSPNRSEKSRDSAAPSQS